MLNINKGDNMLDKTNNPHYDFPIEMVKLKAIANPSSIKPPCGGEGIPPQTYQVPTDMARALVRTDTGDVLGIHGNKYKPITHKHVCDTIEQGIERLCKKFNTNTDNIDY